MRALTGVKLVLDDISSTNRPSTIEPYSRNPNMAPQHVTRISLPATKTVLLEIPAPHVLLVTINRAKQMNSLSVADCWEMDRVWRWFDDELELYAAAHF